MENLEFIGKDNVTFVSKGSTHICITLTKSALIPKEIND